MRRRGALSALVMTIVGLGVSVCATRGQAPATSAKVDTEPLALTPPDRYIVPSVLEAIRRVTIVAPTDGIVRSQDARAGDNVRANQEIAQLDRGEAGPKLKIAQAEVKEAQAVLDRATFETKGSGEKVTLSGRPTVAQAQAQLEAAEARAELAKLAFDQCTLRAPFPGKILDSPVFDGQFVTKGTVLAELADTTSLRALVPVHRAGTTVGGNITLNVEGQPVSGKIQALLPLPESLSVLRELASPLAAAWVVLPNAGGTLEPGQRVISPALPSAPLATIPAQALRKADPKDKHAAPTVQVIRNEYVTNVKVTALGSPVPDRVQISGVFRPNDALIVQTTVPLMAGTLIRFNGSEGSGSIESHTPNPEESGTTVSVTPPRAGSRVAPIGAPGSAVPGTRPAASRPAPNPPAARPATKGAVPF